MPIIGTREARVPGSNGYSSDPMADYAKEFLNVSQSIVNEAKINYFEKPLDAFMHQSSEEALRQFFVENSADLRNMKAEEQEDHIEMMNEMFTNDKEGMRSYIHEHHAMNVYNPVIGLSYPIHKNIMMNTIFDKGAIPKMVAVSPKFTVSMETRHLIDPVTGEKIDFFREQYKMTDAIEKAAPLKSMYMALPEATQTDVLLTLFGRNSKHDHLSIESYVSGIVGSRVVYPGQTVQVVVATTDAAGAVVNNIVKYTNNTTDAVVVKAGATGLNLVDSTGAAVTGDVVGAIFDFKGKFAPAYGTYDRQICEQFSIANVDSVAAGTLEGTWALTLATGEVIDNTTSEKEVPSGLRTSGFISGYMKDDRFGLTSSNPAVTGIILTSRLDTSSAMLSTASVTWSTRTDIIEIPNAIPINVTVSPEEIKDIAALYNVNQLTKIMSLIKTSLNNYKDDKIKRDLDLSFITMPDENKIGRSFDFAPTSNFALDPVTWRRSTFMDSLDTHVTQLLHVLNDPNMTVNVIGRDDLIRKITPTEYTYQTPSNIGPVQLDFVKTVVTSDKRTYQFISADKFRDSNNLMIILCPRNSDRFMYRIYDYQMYVSNEIRNAENPSLPAVHAFERWKFEEYQPVQGRIRILNPTGLRNYKTDYAFNNDPIGRGDNRGVASIGRNDMDIDAR